MSDPEIRSFRDRMSGYATRYENGRWIICPCCGGPPARRQGRAVYRRAAKRSARQAWKREET